MKNEFTKLFGIDPSKMHEDVIVTPFLSVDYFRQTKTTQRTKGYLFEVLTEKEYSVIKTGVGAPFVGDACLYLQSTPCERVYFVGSCGAVSDCEVGEIVAVNRWFQCESFSRLAQGKFDLEPQNITTRLTQQFQQENPNIRQCSAATIGSLSLQETLRDSLRANSVDVVDMEVSAFFTALSQIKKEGIAVLYVTDRIGEKPFYRDLSLPEKTAIKLVREKSIQVLVDCVRKQGKA